LFSFTGKQVYSNSKTIMEYKYKIGNSREIKKGVIEAGSREEAYDLIKKEGYFVLELKEKSGFNFTFKNKSVMSEFERINLTDHMASMISAGTPLREALDAYSDDSEGKSQIISRIVSDIERGKPLSVALLNFPKIFSPLYIALTKAGELSGSLDETLSYMANELRREHEFKSKIRSAMFYPALVLIVSVLVVILVVTTVIPRVAEITKSLGAQMPLLTRIVVNSSNFLINHYLLFITILTFLIISSTFLLRKRTVREILKVKLLRFPLIGSIMKKYILARLLRIIGSCVKYGIPLPAAFDAAINVVDNDTYKKAVERINKKITKGETLASAISAESKNIFPGIIARSIKGAQSTGTIDTTLFRLSTQYQIEVDRDIKRATELMEPIMIVILGIVVLGIAVSVIAPIYQLTSNL
jgi:type II secretory pathway component PulF